MKESSEAQNKPEKKKRPSGYYENKTVMLRTRVPKAEKQTFIKEAERLKLTLFEYVRERIYNGHITVRTVDMTEHKVLFELSKIGNNLNQSVRRLNTIKGANEELEAELRLIADELRGISEKLKEKLSIQ